MGNKSSSTHFMSLHGFWSKCGINAPSRTLHSEAAPVVKGHPFSPRQARRGELSITSLRLHENINVVVQLLRDSFSFDC